MLKWIALWILCIPSLFYGMTLEQKIGQLLMVHFQGETANEDAALLIQKVGVGGIIYYNWANTLRSPEQISQLSASLQKLASTPLLIAVDQEGGRVTRCREGFTQFPGNGALGILGDPALVEESALIMGQELYAVGINLNLAPVVDINNNPRNPVIGTRSFGDSPTLVTLLGGSAVRGFHKAGIATCLKHFPGHGDVTIDSHKSLPIVYKTRSQLQELELIPFAKLAAQTDAIMTAHIMLPAIDPIHCATLSKNILDILRQEIGFTGVIISDSLMMQGVLDNGGSIEAVTIQALNAGCDLLLLGGSQLVGNVRKELGVSDVQRIHQALVTAVKEGRILEARVDEALAKVARLKKKYITHKRRMPADFA